MSVQHVSSSSHRRLFHGSHAHYAAPQQSLYANMAHVSNNCANYATPFSTRSAFRPLKPPRRTLHQSRSNSELEEYAKQYEESPSRRSSFVASTNDRFASLPRPRPRVVGGLSRSGSVLDSSNRCYVDMNNNNNNYSTMSLPRRVTPVKKLVSAFNSQIEANYAASTPKPPIYSTLQRRLRMNRRQSQQHDFNGGRRKSASELDAMPPTEYSSAEKIIAEWGRQVQVGLDHICKIPI